MKSKHIYQIVIVLTLFICGLPVSYADQFNNEQYHQLNDVQNSNQEVQQKNQQAPTLSLAKKDKARYEKEVIAFAKSTTTIDPTKNFKAQFLAQYVTGDPVHDISALSLASPDAIRFCLWAASKAQDIKHYTFIPGNPLIIKRNNAMFKTHAGLCDCYQLSEKTISNAQNVTGVFLEYLKLLSAPTKNLTMKQRTYYDHIMLETYKKVKNQVIQQQCQNDLSGYMETLRQCPVSNCESYEDKYGNLRSNS